MSDRHVTIDGGDAPETRTPLQAHDMFFDTHLGSIQKAMDDEDVASLTIILPPAPSQHDAWRHAVAGDLAREFTPRRINIASGSKGEALNQLLSYLKDAPGVTGHYVQSHEQNSPA